MDQTNFLLARLFAGREGGEVSFCVVVRRKPDPAAGWFVPLYKLLDANVFLGCLCDARRNVKEWLEIWVQIPARKEHAEAALDLQLNNTFLDQKWRQRAEVLERLEPHAFFAGPWQEDHPLPLFFAKDPWEPVVLTNPQYGGHVCWELCRQDTVLKSAGLPAYSESGFRYLYNASQGSNSKFIAMDDAAPRNVRVLTRNPDAGFPDELVSFNPEAGLLFIRKHSPLSLRVFKRLLEGHVWDGAGQGLQTIVPDPAYEPFRDEAYFQNNHGLIFSGNRGREGRVLECFLLKLLLLQEAVAQVAAVVKAESRPFLNLTADDFRVRLPTATRRLPSSWGFELNLCRTSESVALAVEGKGSRFFKPLRTLPPSVYQPKQMSPSRQGLASVRVRVISAETDGTTVFEGTLADVELFAIGASDLLWLALPVGGERLAFHARALSDQNLAQTEVRFRTLPRVFSAPLREALNLLKGVPIPDIPYRVTPVASSPCDLYSLAVIGLEILIDTEKVALAVALDECLSLARQVASQNRELPFAVRRARSIEQEPRFWNSLGPQNVCREPLERAAACALVPPELWWECFDVIIRMLPGIDPTAWARDLGDVNSFALESCFSGTLDALEQLVERARSLLFMDLTANREVRKLLEEFAELAG